MIAMGWFLSGHFSEALKRLGPWRNMGGVLGITTRRPVEFGETDCRSLRDIPEVPLLPLSWRDLLEPHHLK